MKEITDAAVSYHGRKVGTLALTGSGKGAFQYSREWLADGFSISPFSLPLENRVFVPKSYELDGLFGVFSDSLPDGWGRLLVDRMLRSKGRDPETVNPVMRLGIVGTSGMGALEYRPEVIPPDTPQALTFDEIAAECKKILNEESTANLDTLFLMGGSSGGARPKVLTSIENEPWIVKFPSSYDALSIGKEEYLYMQCAKECGITASEVRLLPSNRTSGYFAVKRFDRTSGTKIHMITAGGLLETSHRVPSLDYHDLMKLTYILTRDNSQLEEMYKRMCFNVFAHNRDDHAKNFSYLYDENERRWKLSPAYDLTYSSSIGGEHATSVNGNGRDPGLDDLIAVGEKCGLSKLKLKKTAEETAEIVQSMLGSIISKK